MKLISPLKLKNMARLIMLHLLIKGKPAVDLQRIKRRVKILTKFLGKLVNGHHQALTCCSHDVHVPCPREYEFSCTNSPAAPPLPHVTKFKTRSKRHYPCSSHYYSHKHLYARKTKRGQHARLDGPALRPEKSPLGRQVGLEDYMKLQPLMCCVDGDHDHDDDECDRGCCVDRAAEEFIQRFYKELRQQKLYFPS